MIKSIRAVLAGCFMVLGAGVADAADWYQTGNISALTTTTEGLMIMLDTGPPTNCTGTPWNWMLIPEANKTMVAATLALWLSGKRNVTVYVLPFTAGWCSIIQVQPNG